MKKKKLQKTKANTVFPLSPLLKLPDYRLKANTFTGSLHYSSTRRTAQEEREGVAGQKRERLGVHQAPLPPKVRSYSHTKSGPIYINHNQCGLFSSPSFIHIHTLSLYISRCPENSDPESETRTRFGLPHHHHPRDFSWWVVVLL